VLLISVAVTPAVRTATEADAPAMRDLIVDAGLPLEGFAGIWARWVAADTREGRRAGVGLLTETAAGYFDRFDFTATAWSGLPAVLDEVVGCLTTSDRA
jgi:hypothetical protein